MVTMIVLTVLALPLVVLTARIGRKRWVEGRAAGRVRAGMFRHWVWEEPSGRHLIRS